MTGLPRRCARLRSAIAAAALVALAAQAAADAPLAAAPPGASVSAPLSAEEFRAFAEGWTLHFELDGVPFGVESFGHGGRTLWRPEGGTCAPGFWAAVGAEVCFYYGEGSACWLLWRDEGGVIARSASDGALEVRVSRRNRDPVACDAELLSGALPAASAG